MTVVESDRMQPSARRVDVVPARLARAASLTITGLAVIATVLVAAGLIHLLRGGPLPRAPLLLGAGVVSAAVLWASLRLPPAARVVVAILAVLGVLVVYAAEMFL